MKGICFIEPLFRATIQGRKTMTRRIIDNPSNENIYNYYYKFLSNIGTLNQKEFKPRYKVGEIVYLKEPYCLDCDFIQNKYSKEWKANGKIRYKYNGDELSELSRLASGFNVWSNKLFMPEKYARYFIKIISVKLERLQDISDTDCIAEGIFEHYENEYKRKNGGHFIYSNGLYFKNYDTQRLAYAALIDKINGKGTWERNPYVFVYEYELIKIK
jgi:hypothetical protein